MSSGPVFRQYVESRGNKAFDLLKINLHPKYLPNLSLHNVPYSSVNCSINQFKRATGILYQKYFPIEMDITLTVEEKVPYMVEWWSKAHRLLVGEKLTRNDVKQMLADTYSKLREGMAELIIQCKEKNIPLLIFSAGVGSK